MPGECFTHLAIKRSPADLTVRYLLGRCQLFHVHVQTNHSLTRCNHIKIQSRAACTNLIMLIMLLQNCSVSKVRMRGLDDAVDKVQKPGLPRERCLKRAVSQEAVIVTNLSPHHHR